jgi:hypothetical protein
MPKYFLLFEIEVIDNSDGNSCGTFSKERTIDCDPDHIAACTTGIREEMQAFADAKSLTGFYTTVTLKQVVKL